MIRPITSILIALVGLASPALAAQAEPERWELREDRRYGAVDGPGSLTTINGILVDPRRRQVYVAQPQENLIRVLDASTGSVLRTIGRSGGGPGEFQGLSRIGWKGDTLFAVDMAMRHLSLFSAEGVHLRTDRVVSPPLQATGAPALPSAYLSDGTFIGSSPLAVNAAVAGQITTSPWVQLTREGTILRTIAVEEIRDAFVHISAGNRGIMLRRPMSTTSFLEVAPDGSSMIVVHAPAVTPSGASFIVSRVRPDGDTVYARAYRYPPRQVSRATVDRIHREHAEMLGRGVPLETARKAVEEQLVLPSTHPPVSRVVVGTDGSVWLRREDTGATTVSWTVLDPEGHVRSIVETPARLRILALDGDVVWGAIAGELDVPYVVRYRAHRAPSQ